MNFLYIHGFASSPESRKARAFRNLLTEAGHQVVIPAVDEGDFQHLTISGQLAVLERTRKNEPIRLMGSSMGGYLAALYASTHPEVERLVLLAPAFDFAPRWSEKATDQEKLYGFLVFHYGENRMRRVDYGLIEDALKYPPRPDFSQPALIFHGRNDDVVPVEISREFAASHPNARLIEMDSGHELTDVFDRIAAEAMPFLLG